MAVSLLETRTSTGKVALPEVLAGIPIVPIARVRTANRQAIKTDTDRIAETPPDSPAEILIALAMIVSRQVMKTNTGLNLNSPVPGSLRGTLIAHQMIANLLVIRMDRISLRYPDNLQRLDEPLR